MSLFTERTGLRGERIVELLARLSSELPSMLKAMDTIVAAGVIPVGAEDFVATGTNRRELLPDGRYRVWHAEQDALDRYASSATDRAVVVVVTLEPCAERVRGPKEDRVSCAQRIVEFATKRCPVAGVVAGAFDGGRGAEQLMLAGIPVTLVHGAGHPVEFRGKSVTQRVRRLERPEFELLRHDTIDGVNRERLAREGLRVRECESRLGELLRVIELAEARGEDGAVVATGAFPEILLEEDTVVLSRRLSTWRTRPGQPLRPGIRRLLKGCVDRQWEERQRQAIVRELRDREARP